MSGKSGRGAKEQSAGLRLKAIRLRQAGWSYPAIAAELDVSVSTAHKYVKRSLEEIRSKTWLQTEQYVTLESERLDRLQLQPWTAALSGDLKAALVVLKIMERRAKLLGLDMSDRHRINTNEAIKFLLSNLRFYMSKSSYTELLEAYRCIEEGELNPAAVDELEAVRVLLDSESMSGAFPDETLESIGAAYADMKKAIAAAFDPNKN